MEEREKKKMQKKEKRYKEMASDLLCNTYKYNYTFTS